MIGPMTATENQIRAYEADINRLQEAIHVAYNLRAHSDAHHAACREFHGFQSVVSTSLERIDKEGLSADVDLRAFAFRYLAVDPYYFRSGYAKQDLLRLIKRLSLTADEREVLQELIIRRIQTRALREFRALCRCIPLLASEAFYADVLAAAQDDDRAVARRAAFALGYFPRQTGSRFSANARAPSS